MMSDQPIFVETSNGDGGVGDDWLSGGGDPFPDSAPAVEIGIEAAEKIDAVLADLVAEVRLDFAALLNDSGALLGWAGAENDDESPAEIAVECSAALAMGTFAAAQALAAQLGGDESRELLHHAGARSFYLTEVAPGLALFGVWSGDLAPGFLRSRARRAVKGLIGAMGDEIASGGSLSIAVAPRVIPEEPKALVASGLGNRLAGDSAELSKDRYVFEIG